MSRRISLVVATYDRAGPLDTLLGCVARQSLPPTEFEVLVCVDGSRDRTPEVLEAWRRRGAFQLEVLEQENQGQAAARNRAMAKALSPRVAVVDDDMDLSGDFLAEHLRAADEDPEHIAVLGKVVPQEGWRSKPLYEQVREQAQLELHRRLEAGEPANATAFITQNVSVPTRLALALGGFDPTLRLSEDLEFGARLERGGARFVFAPAAWAIHRSDIGSYHRWERRQFDYGTSALRIWERYGRDPYLHPLRNLVNGHRWNRAAVTLFSPSARRTWLGSRSFRLLGGLLLRLGLRGPAVATHKAILAVQYHHGLGRTLGSWSALRAMAEEYRARTDRPLQPTGQGMTTASASAAVSPGDSRR